MRIRLYHGTTERFDGRMSFDVVNRPDAHPNGRLGLWVADNEELASRFGDHVLEIEASYGAGQTVSMRVSELMVLGTRLDGDGFDALRRKWVSEGYVAFHLVEKDGSIPTRVLLCEDAVVSCRWLEATPAPAP